MIRSFLRLLNSADLAGAKAGAVLCIVDCLLLI
jgi:hypothetical protein